MFCKLKNLLAAGMDSSNWSRWYVKNVEENMFFVEGKEYQRLDIVSNGRDMKDITCTLAMAKCIRTFFHKNWYVTPEGIIFLTKKFKTMDDNKAW